MILKSRWCLLWPSSSDTGWPFENHCTGLLCQFILQRLEVFCAPLTGWTRTATGCILSQLPPVFSLCISHPKALFVVKRLQALWFLDVMPFSCYISSQGREIWWEMCCHPPVIVDVVLFWSTFRLAFYSFWPDYHFTKKTETKIKTKRFQLPSGLIYCWGPKCPSLLRWSMWLCRKKDAFLAISLT